MAGKRLGKWKNARPCEKMALSGFSFSIRVYEMFSVEKEKGKEGSFFRNSSINSLNMCLLPFLLLTSFAV